MLFFDKRTEKARKTLKKFKNKKFDYSKYLKDFYVEDGQAYISIKVDSINDIISRYSIKEYEWINIEFADYIEKNAYYIPVEYPIVIEICGCEFSEEEKALIDEVIHDYFGLKLGDTVINLDINSRKSLVLLLGGLFVLAIMLLISEFGTSGTPEFILILFWFFSWEYVDLSWLNRAELRQQKIEAGQLASVKVMFDEKSR